MKAYLRLEGWLEELKANLTCSENTSPGAADDYVSGIPGYAAKSALNR